MGPGGPDADGRWGLAGLLLTILIVLPLDLVVVVQCGLLAPVLRLWGETLWLPRGRHSPMPPPRPARETQQAGGCCPPWPAGWHPLTRLAFHMGLSSWTRPGTWEGTTCDTNPSAGRWGHPLMWAQLIPLEASAHAQEACALSTRRPDSWTTLWGAQALLSGRHLQAWNPAKQGATLRWVQKTDPRTVERKPPSKAAKQPPPSGSEGAPAELLWL